MTYNSSSTLLITDNSSSNFSSAFTNFVLYCYSLDLMKAFIIPEVPGSVASIYSYIYNDKLNTACVSSKASSQLNILDATT